VAAPRPQAKRIDHWSTDRWAYTAAPKIVAPRRDAAAPAKSATAAAPHGGVASPRAAPPPTCAAVGKARGRLRRRAGEMGGWRGRAAVGGEEGPWTIELVTTRGQIGGEWRRPGLLGHSLTALTSRGRGGAV
jgi:hypothetical protein